MAAILKFLPLMQKQIASISLTIGDRAILSKFSTHKVFLLFPNMAAILNFPIFSKNAKTQNYFHLLNRSR